jgi:pimeloyl-ACP methyl ester carboxylesterase
VLEVFFGLLEDLVRDHPEFVYEALRRTEASSWDQPVMSEPAVKKMFNDIFADVYSQGSRGLCLDAMVPCRPWGFRLRDIDTPIQLYYGEGDSLIPLEFGKHIQTLLPRSTAKFFSSRGHFLFIENWSEILNDTFQ